MPIRAELPNALLEAATATSVSTRERLISAPKTGPVFVSKKAHDKMQETVETMQSSPIALREKMNKRQTWVRADKLQPGDRVQDANGNIVTIKDVNKGLWPGSILITLRDASPDFAYLESDTKIFVE